MAVTSAFPCCDCACAEAMRATTASDALQTISRPVTLCINFIVTPGFFMCRDINWRNLERLGVRCQCNFPLFGNLKLSFRGRIFRSESEHLGLPITGPRCIFPGETLFIPIMNQPIYRGEYPERGLVPGWEFQPLRLLTRQSPSCAPKYLSPASP